MKYALIEDYFRCFDVSMMCRLLAVPRSSFYAQRNRSVSSRHQRRALLSLAVETTYVEYKKRYGAPRIAIELNAQGIHCSVNHVAD